MKKRKGKERFVGDLFEPANFADGSATANLASVQVSLPTNVETCHSSSNPHQFDELFERLSQSTFRNKFHLTPKEQAYLIEKGMDTIRQHATDFVKKRLAPAIIPNDGKQTPMRGHPVFIAQHATGCCCRGCFSKWHHIPAGRELTQKEQLYAVDVMMEWIRRQKSSQDLFSIR